MKVLTLGWEFPPYFAGGVGVVCESLSRAQAALGEEITFVMPAGPVDASADHLRLVVASQHTAGLRAVRVGSLLQAYQTEEEYLWLRRLSRTRPGSSGALYGPDLISEVRLFGSRLLQIVEELELSFEVVHAHDWTTFPAALELRARTGRPLVVHVHITEFDKTGGDRVDPRIYAIERSGMHGADAVIAVSNLVKERCVERYGVNPDKVWVVHNAVDRVAWSSSLPRLVKREKTVMFLGRLTLQKGPDYFVRTARRVLDVDPDVTFILAGTGDMTPSLIELSAELGIGSRMLFTGFVDRHQASQLYAAADVFVMPSVSEPFGLVALEAMDHGVPVILSRQSGASEVVRHALKVDFWDVEDLADKVLCALAYPSLHGELRRMGEAEVEQLHWRAAAQKVRDVYDRIVRSNAVPRRSSP